MDTLFNIFNKLLDKISLIEIIIPLTVGLIYYEFISNNIIHSVISGCTVYILIYFIKKFNYWYSYIDTEQKRRKTANSLSDEMCSILEHLYDIPTHECVLGFNTHFLYELIEKDLINKSIYPEMGFNYHGLKDPYRCWLTERGIKLIEENFEKVNGQWARRSHM